VTAFEYPLTFHSDEIPEFKNRSTSMRHAHTCMHASPCQLACATRIACRRLCEVAVANFDAFLYLVVLLLFERNMSYVQKVNCAFESLLYAPISCQVLSQALHELNAAHEVFYNSQERTARFSDKEWDNWVKAIGEVHAYLRPIFCC